MNERNIKTRDANLDPISKEPGSHPVGTGVGAALGGAAAGAAVGTVAGPIGTAVGAAAGAVIGGLAGKGVAEAIDPTAEEAYWRANYATRPYATDKASYDVYAPAYRYGWEARARHADRSWDEAVPELRQRWIDENSHSSLTWDGAAPAVRDAWDRVGTVYGRRTH